jgi:hypothetical protein
MALSKPQVSLIFGDELGNLRGTFDPTFGYLFSIKDFINMVKGKAFGSKYGNKAWFDMLNSEFGDDLAKLVHSVFLPGLKQDYTVSLVCPFFSR